jgi:GMP synthase-like glutamine amidotransferase
MKMLVLQHVPFEGVGYIGEYAKERGFELTVIDLWKPDTIPDTAEYGLVIILGGPMGVYDDFPSKQDEIELIRANYTKVPMVGVCLGSQLLAHALGAHVGKNEKGKEVGYYDIKLTDEGKNSTVFGDFSSPFKAFQWHGDAFELPKDAKLLATSPICANQAFSVGKAHGFLFHFEFTPEKVDTLIEVDNNWAHTDFQLDDDAVRKASRELAPLMREQCFRLLDNVLA